MADEGDEFRVLGTCFFCDRMVYTGKFASIPVEQREAVLKEHPSHIEKLGRAIGRRFVCTGCADDLADMMIEIENEREEK